MTPSRLRDVLLLATLLTVPATAVAGPWTRDSGHFFLGVSYFRIAAREEGDVDARGLIQIRPYTQQVVTFYGELGLVDRWLTASLDGTIWRRSRLAELTAQGIGDWRLGVWSGLVTRPVRLTLAFLVHLPLGDASPATAPCRDDGPPPLCLPNGQGVGGLEGKLSLGYSFGGWRYWPLRHYVLAEAGYWGRFGGYAGAVTYRAELGIQLPWRGIRRVWWMGRLSGVESLIGAAALRLGFQGQATGLGNGISYAGYGLEVYGRVHKGLGLSLGADSALRSRLIPLGAQIKVSVSYEY